MPAFRQERTGITTSAGSRREEGNWNTPDQGWIRASIYGRCSLFNACHFLHYWFLADRIWRLTLAQQADDLAPLHIARRLFQWYLEPTDDPATLSGIFAGYRVGRFTDYVELLLGVLHSENFNRDREALLHKWSPCFNRKGGLSLKEANDFLRSWSESLDHRLMFTRSVTVGSTNARKSSPYTDYQVSYYSNRNAWTLHLIVRGAVEYVAGREIIAERGDLLLISPDASCHYGRKPEIEQWLHYWAVFQPQPHWQELMQWPVSAPGIFKLNVEEETDFLAFENLFEQMFRLNEEEDGMFTQQLQANLLEHFLLRAASYLVSRGMEPVDMRVLKATDYLAKHIRSSDSVAAVASLCNLSESHLSHLFQQYFGVGVHKYRSNLRLQRAKKLLATTGESIAQIAEAVGYEDPAQFSKFFSKNIGYSPREFRASFKLLTVK